MSRSPEGELVRYEQMSELFRRLTSLDERSLGPELAKLQNVATTLPPRALGLRGRIRSILLAIISPILGRLLKAASLASPYQAAYELAVEMQERQLQLETKICTELAALNSRIEGLEAEIRSRRLSA